MDRGVWVSRAGDIPGLSWQALVFLNHYFGPQVRMAVVALVLGTVVALVLRRRYDDERPAAWCMAATFALAVLVLTLTPQTDGYAASVQLVPLATIRLQLAGLSPELIVVNLVGNVAVFMPVGFFVTLALAGRHRHPLLAATALGAALSLLCEVLQWASGARSADVDDLLLNTLGAALGAVTAGIVAAHRRRRRRRSSTPGRAVVR